MSSQPVDAADLRQRLLEGAARLLGEEGPSALSTRRLASEAGTSTMAVYTHFGGMPALVREVVAEGFARLAAHMAEVEHTDDALDDLRRLATAYRQNALDNPHLYAVMFGTASLGGYRLTHEELEIGRYTFDGLVDATRRVMEAGGLRPDNPEYVAGQLWSALHGYVMLELAGYHREETAEHVLWPMLANLITALRP
jgi:AcrR family transcriptional regulator